MGILVTILSLHAVISLLWVTLVTAFWILERGRFPRVDRRRLGTFFREWAAVVVFIPLRLAGLWMRAPRPSRGLGRRDPADLPPESSRLPPVVLVPGYSMNRTCLSFLAMFLRRRGWRWVWPVNNGPFSSPVPVMAHTLGQRIEALCRRTGTDQVDSVAHSMGGVVAAWYVQELGGHRRVRRVVTLGTPYHGSKLAVFGARREARDIEPGSEIVAALRPPTVSWTSIWSHEDGIILPPTSSSWPGAREIALRHIGHLGLLMSAHSFRAVADALVGAPPLLGDSAGGATEHQASPQAAEATRPGKDDMDAGPTAGEG